MTSPTGTSFPFGEHSWWTQVSGPNQNPLSIAVNTAQKLTGDLPPEPVEVLVIGEVNALLDPTH